MVIGPDLVDLAEQALVDNLTMMMVLLHRPSVCKLRVIRPASKMLISSPVNDPNRIGYSGANQASRDVDCKNSQADLWLMLLMQIYKSIIMQEVKRCLRIETLAMGKTRTSHLTRKSSILSAISKAVVQRRSVRSKECLYKNFGYNKCILNNDVMMN